MQVARWGNSLAVRLPRAVVETLDLREGDAIEIVVAGPRRFEVARDPARAEALARAEGAATAAAAGLPLRSRPRE